MPFTYSFILFRDPFAGSKAKPTNKARLINTDWVMFQRKVPPKYLRLTLQTASNHHRHPRKWDIITRRSTDTSDTNLILHVILLQGLCLTEQVQAHLHILGGKSRVGQLVGARSRYRHSRRERRLTRSCSKLSSCWLRIWFSYNSLLGGELVLSLFLVLCAYQICSTLCVMFDIHPRCGYSA